MAQKLILRVWPIGTCEGWNFAKSRNFQSLWKFGLNMRVLTTANHQRMKFDNIHKNFDLCWKFHSKMRYLTMTSRPAKDEVWQNSEIFSRIENLAHIMRVLTPTNQQRMKFGKIQKFLVVLKIWHKIWEFWTFRICKGWNLAKSRNFQLRWKFGSDYESLDHSEPAKDEIWQNPEKLWFVLEIWLKNEIFDHFGPAKDEIWQNSEIFSRVENLAQIMRVLTTPNQQRMKFDKIQKNFDFCWKFGWKIRFLTTPNQQRMKFGKIQKNFSRAENLAQNLRVLNTQDMQRMKFGKIQKFSVGIENLAQIMRVLTTPNQQRMKFDKIWKNFDLCWKFGSKMRFWPLRTCEGWKLAKFRNF